MLPQSLQQINDDTNEDRTAQNPSYQQPFAMPPRPPQNLKANFEVEKHHQAEAPSARFGNQELQVSAPEERTQAMPPVSKNLTPAAKIAQNHAMNDDFMANIRAKLDMLGQV